MVQSITPSLSPNTTSSDVLKAVQVTFMPWRYVSGSAPRQLEQWFRTYFKTPYAISFNMGRSALYAILKSLGVSKGDEVLLQAFTCVVVPDAIVTLSAVPVYVDILDSLTIDPKDLEKKITSKTKAILVQHTFGISSNMKEIMRIAKKHKVPVIEDVAHTIGGEYEGKKLGTFGDAAFFSFGRDKAFSSVFGGMVITKNTLLGKKIRLFQKQLPSPSYFWVFQQLLHPIAFSLILPVYSIGIGKAVLVVLQKLQLLSFPVTTKEKSGTLDAAFIKKMPNGLASLALVQLKKLKEFNVHRESIVSLYLKSLPKHYQVTSLSNLPLLRFPMLVENPPDLILHMRKENIYLGKWYSEVIDPKGSDLTKVNYKKGMCKNAEQKASRIVNLPTHPKLSYNQARHIVRLFNSYVKDSRNK